MVRTCTLLTLTAVLSSAVVTAQHVRPVRDSVGFCWDADEMHHLIRFLHESSPPAEAHEGNLVAAISVHDDYLYAGRVYYPLYKTIRAKEVIIVGVTHGTVSKELGPLSNVLIFDDYEQWRGPYGNVEISPLRQLLRAKLPTECIMVSNRAHAIEHSIEAVVPFLQYYNRDVKITPIMVTRMSFEKMEDLSSRLAGIIADYMQAHRLEIGKDVLLLMSNDANHYGPDFNNAPYGTDARAHETATENDKRIINTCLTGEISTNIIRQLTSEIWSDSTRPGRFPLWCGRYAITFGLLTTSRLLASLGRGPMSGSLLKYSDSFSEKVLPLQGTSMGVTAVFSYQHWCGWFTEGFYTHRP